MRKHLVGRCAALTLVFALLAPAAWAWPGVGVLGFWEWVWGWWSEGVATKEGPCISPLGQPCTAPSTLAEPEAARRPLRKEGICIDPMGKPCVPQ